MPWTGPSFQHHNSHLSPAQSAHAAAIANAMLRRGTPEGESIATANKLIHRDDGGMVPATPAPTPGLQPNISNQGPQAQNIIQRFSAMSPEQLRELTPRLSGQMQQIATRVLQQKSMQPQASYTQPQQPTQAIPQLGVSASPGTQPAQQALGGNVMFPGGAVPGFAKGGAPKIEHPGVDRDDCVPILAAGGEFVISPHYAARLGDGDVSKGHKLLDEWVVKTRKQIVEKTRSLRGPVRS